MWSNIYIIKYKNICLYAGDQWSGVQWLQWPLCLHTQHPCKSSKLSQKWRNLFSQSDRIQTHIHISVSLCPDWRAALGLQRSHSCCHCCDCPGEGDGDRLPGQTGPCLRSAGLSLRTICHIMNDQIHLVWSEFLTSYDSLHSLRNNCRSTVDTRTWWCVWLFTRTWWDLNHITMFLGPGSCSVRPLSAPCNLSTVLHRFTQAATTAVWRPSNWTWCRIIAAGWD